MPFTKVWTSAGTALSTATYWQAISVRNSAYAWTASGSGTNEYYLRTAGGSDPGFQAIPGNVYIDGSDATVGSVGSLAAGRWGYGDNDTLGYSTLYVRLSDGADPDSKAADFVKFYQVPKASEHVRLPASSGSIVSGLDLSAVAIGAFVVENGYRSSIAAATGYLLIDPDSFQFDAVDGVSYIDIGTANIPVSILGSGSGTSQGLLGLYLRGSAITTADIRGGFVGIAALGGETSTVATLVQRSGTNTTSKVVAGAGCGITAVHLYAGELRLRCSSTITTVLQYGGSLYLEESCGVTTLTQHGGTCEWNSSGNVGTVNGYGGTFDEMKCGLSRTVTTVNRYSGTWKHNYNKEAVTHTSIVNQISGPW